VQVLPNSRSICFSAAILAFVSLLTAQKSFAQDPPPPSDPAIPAADATSGAVPGDPTTAPPPANPMAQSPTGSGVAAPAIPTNILAGILDPFVYESRGRRDPFAQPIDDRPAAPGLAHGPLLPLQQFDLNQIRLVGIIWDVAHPKAMLKDPSGKTHIVGQNTKIGPRNGYIAVIREGEMVVVETIDRDGKLISTSQVVKIAK
jgi:type IV pilus assembly protein PilP